jgi:hypothetical protein
MTRRAANIETAQPGLFDRDEPSVELRPALRARLATLVVALLLEITVALASGEGGDEQDHR